MHIAHHPIFVVLSMLIACLGSWTALDLFRRVRAHAGQVSMGWLAASGVAMGLSIWSMHFIAMLGFNPGAEVRYHIGLTLTSLVLAIAVTAFAFFFAAEQPRIRLMLAGVVMGLGICLMHYIGMAAVITSVHFHHDPRFVLLAFLCAATASIGALVVALRNPRIAQRVLAALLLGFAIVGMHYSAMFGVRISGITTEAVHNGIDSVALALAMAAGTAFILLLALIAAMFDRRFATLAAREALRSEQQLREIIEHLPVGVFVAAAPSGEIRMSNAEAERLLGHPIDTISLWDQQGDIGPVHEDGTRLQKEEHAIYQAITENRRVGPRLAHYRRGDGSILSLEVMAAPVHSVAKGNERIVVTFHDVTAKLAAEKQALQNAALRESEQRFRHIAEQAPVMLWMADAEGRSVYFNKALRDFWGVSGDISNFDWTAAVLNEDRAEFVAHIEAARRRHEDFSMEMKSRRADGATRLLQTIARARFNSHSEYG